MRIAVAGATGNIGRLTVTGLERQGHQVRRLSRSLGVDLTAGDGLDEALAGVDAVIDVTNSTATDPAETVTFFGTATRHLLAAEARAGVAHHVLLSIVGIHAVEGNAHYAGKREQERLVSEGPIPWTIVPATQFHDFAAMVAGWHEHDGTTTIPPLLIQPIAPADVADVLAEVAVGAPLGRHVDLAGPAPQDLVDMTRRTHQATGREVEIVPSWSGAFGAEMAGDVLLPAADRRVAPTRFEDWLAAQS